MIGVYCVPVAWDINEPLFDSRLGQRLLSSLYVHNGSVAHPVACPTGTEGCVMVKRHHSTLSSFEVKYSWSCASILPYAFFGLVFNYVEKAGLSFRMIFFLYKINRI